MTLIITAASATVKSIETAPNVTTSTIIVQKAMVMYRDSMRTLSMGFASLTLTVTIKYAELLANIDATVILPLWTAIVNRLTGSTITP
jgi:hypothetical protein